jgi:hypothetical protein
MRSILPPLGIALALLALVAPATVSAQDAAGNPTLSVDPDQPGATPHWTIGLAAPYCGGLRIGEGVYVRPEAPLTLPASLPDGSVLFEGHPASVSQVGDALRIGPAPDTVWSMICQPGVRPFRVELLPEFGLALPTDAGSYALDVWTGANPTPATVSVDVPAPAAQAELSVLGAGSDTWLPDT